MTDLRQRSDAHLARTIARCERVMRGIARQGAVQANEPHNASRWLTVSYLRTRCLYEQWRRRQAP